MPVTSLGPIVKPIKQISKYAASEQRRTTSSMVSESVLTWSRGVARVRHRNATIGCSLHHFKLQHARDRGGHHSAVLLLRRGRGDHAVAFDSAGLLPGSGGGIPGKIRAASNAGRDGHGADLHLGAGRGRLRAMDADRGFRRELAEIQQCSAAGWRRRGRQDQRNRGAGFADCAGARRVILGSSADRTQHRAHADLPRRWLSVRAVPGNYLHALPGFFYARGEARALARYVATFSRLAPDRSEEHTSELQSRLHLVCRLLLEKKKTTIVTRL